MADINDIRIVDGQSDKTYLIPAGSYTGTFGYTMSDGTTRNEIKLLNETGDDYGTFDVQDGTSDLVTYVTYPTDAVEVSVTGTNITIPSDKQVIVRRTNNSTPEEFYGAIGYIDSTLMETINVPNIPGMEKWVKIDLATLNVAGLTLTSGQPEKKEVSSGKVEWSVEGYNMRSVLTYERNSKIDDVIGAATGTDYLSANVTGVVTLTGQ